MTIICTLGHVMDHGDWIKFCDLKGINEWCLNEGLADGGETVELTEEEAREIGIF